MGRLLNSSQIWSQVPVASRTVEVNTKTGFSLTAGSYSVRASSTQRGTTVTVSTENTKNATISSVTTTRATVSHDGWSSGQSGSTVPQQTTVMLTAATNVQTSRASAGTLGGDNLTAAFTVEELF